ncbi:hypothetical protein BAUCODRAFT_320271 [Baudoinia panamericana UAMH 10762]|uniref:Uncharacterized protein n=1 Tax=Baudoinia panamericana (strain UAMH 10762) TaxID=717646 RepID=M2MJ12_BAUPA|nr:uncharacterized protein BAUCODRAFT_320271 [Baudoinia panamericana UAMH 10762]EMC91263.1 hypothetical protein BAUCODRAFT_320271 [Baudoinia panamericana UAMH 10762]
MYNLGQSSDSESATTSDTDSMHAQVHCDRVYTPDFLAPRYHHSLSSSARSSSTDACSDGLAARDCSAVDHNHAVQRDDAPDAYKTPRGRNKDESKHFGRFHDNLTDTEGYSVDYESCSLLYRNQTVQTEDTGVQHHTRSAPQTTSPTPLCESAHGSEEVNRDDQSLLSTDRQSLESVQQDSFQLIVHLFDRVERLERAIGIGPPRRFLWIANAGRYRQGGVRGLRDRRGGGQGRVRRVLNTLFG